MISLFMSTIAASTQIKSKRASQDVMADTDPKSQFWRGVPAIYANKDNFVGTTMNYRVEVRSRWTVRNLYFLFICPYEHLNLKPDPKTDVETNMLWNWDVAEVFIGSDFKNIQRYKEFEVSPQGEWIDLDINLDAPHHEDGWVWNSNFKTAARIDSLHHIWYAFMKIPYASIDARPASVGQTLRVNFFLSEGPDSKHRSVVWQPTHGVTFHVPEAFGTLRLDR